MILLLGYLLHLCYTIFKHKFTFLILSIHIVQIVTLIIFNEGSLLCFRHLMGVTSVLQQIFANYYVNMVRLIRKYVQYYLFHFDLRQVLLKIDYLRCIKLLISAKAKRKSYHKLLLFAEFITNKHFFPGPIIYIMNMILYSKVAINSTHHNLLLFIL